MQQLYRSSSSGDVQIRFPSKIPGGKLCQSLDGGGESTLANGLSIAYDTVQPVRASPSEHHDFETTDRVSEDEVSFAQDSSMVSPAGDGMAADGREMNSFVFRRVIDDFNASSTIVEEEEAEYLSLKTDGDDGQIVPTEPFSKLREKSFQTSTDPPLALEPPPWYRRGLDGRRSVRSPLLELHQEIVDFCELVLPTPEEHQLRTAAVQRVTKVIKSIWKQAQVKIFGSFATGLYLPTSDIDVVILDSGCDDTQAGLKALAKALAKEAIAKNLQVIGKARVPIVKFIEIESQVSFDVSFDLQNGPKAAKFIKDALDAVPPLKPLCLVLKIFLQQRELNEVYSGGIGSYALLVMLLTYLQTHPSRSSYGGSSEANTLECNLGVLLVDFLELYGRTLNVKDVGISCRDGGRFYKKKARRFLDSKKPHLLSIEDPQTPTSDIGKNSFNFQKVRFAFMLAHRLLTTVNIEEPQMQAGLLVRIVWVDEKLAGQKKSLPLLQQESCLSFSMQRHDPQDQQRLHLQESQKKRNLVKEEHDFPRGGIEGDHFIKRDKKRKMANRMDGGEQGSFQERVHKRNKQSKYTKLGFKGEVSKVNDLMSLTYPGISAPGPNRDISRIRYGLQKDRVFNASHSDLIGHHLLINSNQDVSFQPRKQGTLWYGESELNPGCYGFQLSRRMKTPKRQKYRGREAVFHGKDV